MVKQAVEICSESFCLRILDIFSAQTDTWLCVKFHIQFADSDIDAVTKHLQFQCWKEKAEVWIKMEAS